MKILGEDNFIAQIAWRRTDNQANIGDFARVKEYIVIYGKKQKVDIYESFISGAIEGLKTAWHILPYIIGIFLAIGIFKSGRGIEILEYIFSPIVKLLNIPKELIGLIIVKPLSGSGALGVYAELVQRVGIDSLTEQMGATIVGASETIFYTMAIYYGSQKIKKTRS